MPIHNPYWVLLSNLADRFDSERMDYLPVEEARRRLAVLAGEDFGLDVGRWNRWLIERGYLREREFRIDCPPN